MDSERENKGREFSACAAPMLEQIGMDLLMLDENSSELQELVGIIERLDEVKDKAEKEGEERAFQFTFAMVELLSGVLCERFENPADVIQSVRDSFNILKLYADALAENGATAQALSEGECQKALENLFEILAVPIVKLNSEGESLFVQKPQEDEGDSAGEGRCEAFAAVLPSLEQVEEELETVCENPGDLPALVGIIEKITAVKTLGADQGEEKTFQLAGALEDLLSDVLCEICDDPKKTLKIVKQALSFLGGHLRNLAEGRREEGKQATDLVTVIENLFKLLDAPVPKLQAEGAPEERETGAAKEPAATSQVQESTSGAGELDEESASTGLPAIFDDVDIYKEFAFECNEHLETIEENILELENSPDDTNLINEIFRPIHSIKGGAGFLSLIGMNKLAHVTETLLDQCRKGELAVTNRIVEACLQSVDALKHMIANLVLAVESPDPDQFACEPVQYASIRREIENILEGKEQEGAPEEAPATQTAAAEPPPVAAEAPGETVAAPSETPAEPEGDMDDENWASRGLPKEIVDEDDLDLLKRFVQQCNEHTETIEEQILSLERNPDDEELINGIFRAIHSIKGDSSFLYLAGISSLSHDTETLLSRLRNKEITASGKTVELCLQSVDALKQMIGNLSRVVEAKEPNEELKNPDIPKVVFGPIRQSIVKFLEEPEKAPMLGEILVESGAISPDQLGEALELQGAPLGEVLARTGMVEPKKVEQALAQQRKAGGAGTAGAAKAIKVDTGKIDLLVNLVGELVIIEAQVVQMAMSLNGNGNNQLMEKNLSHLSKITKELQDRSMALRMMPIKQTFQKMVRLVRDSSKKMNKKVNLVMTGEDTELDKTVVEQISDPLVHMLRNCVDHGIGAPEERKAAGKQEAGTINLDAFYQGDRIIIRVKDDGRGLNRERILEKAWESGLIEPGETPADSEIYNLIFEPGFSTAKVVTDISGRGVGMDVVQKNIDKLRGKIDVESVAGKGTTITISLPLTLAIIDGMVVRVGNEEFIIPTVAIRESIRPRREDMSTVTERGELINVRGDLIPLVRLYNMWNIEAQHTDPCEALVVIVEANGQSGCVMVDELVGQQQIVIKHLGEQFSNVRGIMGATILGSGRVGLILDIDGILKQAQG